MLTTNAHPSPVFSPRSGSSLRVSDLAREPNALADHYQRFRVSERLLLTGHSHQAWPDRARQGQIRAFDDAAHWVDRKWDLSFAEAEKVRQGFAQQMADETGDYALGINTHELLIRFLSALPLSERPRLVTTDGEFHSIRRQLDRLEEEGLEIIRVSADRPREVAELLCREVDDRTAAVLVSAVLFKSAAIVPNLGQVFQACERVGAELLVDVYHVLGVMPFDLEADGLGGAYVVGGGYKYCQLGEGNCFLRLPSDCTLRPAVTGWFAEFGTLSEEGPEDARVQYCTGETRFAGATYDPTSHYRAAEVFAFFNEQGLTPEFLRQVSQHQVGVLSEAFDALDLDPRKIRRQMEIPLQELGGFLVLQSPEAETLVQSLRERGVMTDARGESLRFGPAPYLCDRQLRDAISALGEILKAS